MSLFAEDFGISMKMGDAYKICVLTNYPADKNRNQFYEIFGKTGTQNKLQIECTFPTKYTPEAHNLSLLKDPLYNIKHDEWSLSTVWETITKYTINNKYISCFHPEDFSEQTVEGGMVLSFKGKLSKYSNPIIIVVVLTERSN